MTSTLTSPTTSASTGPTTRRLLVGGVVAGPLYLGVSLVQAFTREGFDVTKHPASMLSNGDLGWIQVTNFLVTGLLVIAGAVGVRRALRSTAAGVLLTVTGLAMIAAGLFKADPAMGFPAGTPDTVPAISFAGAMHFAAAGIGFACLAAAGIVIGRRLARAGSRGLARYSWISAVVFLATWLVMMAGGGAAATMLVFWAGIIAIFTWLTVVSAALR